MARSYEEYPRRGATIAAVVIDAPGRNAAMVAKLALPFPILSDPTGQQTIKPFDVWDEAGAMSRPAIIVLAPDGNEVFRSVGVDFMDRPHEDETLAALTRLDLPPLDLPIQPVPHLEPAPGPRATPLNDLAIYLRGVRFSSLALGGRARDPFDRDEAMRTTKMAERFIAAQGATRTLIGTT